MDFMMSLCEKLLENSIQNFTKSYSIDFEKFC